MVFSEILIKIPYTIVWNIITFFRKEKQIAFYCDNELDYIVFKNIHKHLDNIVFIAKNKKTQARLKKYNINAKLYPQFPDVLIIARVSLHKFPAKGMLKIGMQHGVYHFKNFISPKKYSPFDLYFVTSEYEKKEAIEHGIKNVVSGSYPKIDNLFDKLEIENYEKLKEKYKDKKIILFTSTWDKSGLSAIDKWYDKLDDLSNKYHIFVSIHQWTDTKYKNILSENERITLIKEVDMNRYLYISDYLIGDTSSIIGEFASLKKPILTFEIKAQGRLSQNIVNMLDDITFRINEFEEIEIVLDEIEQNGNIKLKNYDKYLNILFDLPLGDAGKKRAKIIKDFLEKKLKK